MEICWALRMKNSLVTVTPSVVIIFTFSGSQGHADHILSLGQTLSPPRVWVIILHSQWGWMLQLGSTSMLRNVWDPSESCGSGRKPALYYPSMGSYNSKSTVCQGLSEGFSSQRIWHDPGHPVSEPSLLLLSGRGNLRSLKNRSNFAVDPMA